MEKWKTISGFPGYSISSKGRVKSRKNYRGNITNVEHILKPRVNPNGYSIVTLYDTERIPHQLSVHRLVAKTFAPVVDATLVVDHLDTDKSNNSVENLEWVTRKENSVRAYNAGLYERTFAKTRRPVLVTDLRTGDQTYYEGLNDASRAIGFSPAALSKVANGYREQVGHYDIDFAGREERLLYSGHHDDY